MLDTIRDAIPAALASPAACELEVLRSDMGVVGTANAIEAAVRAAGASLVNRYAETDGVASFSPPKWECVVFRARAESGYARRRDHFLLVPAVQAIVEREPGGEVWVRFEPAGRRFGAADMPEAA